MGVFLPTNVDVDGLVDGFPLFFNGNLLENSPAPEPLAWPAPAPGRAGFRRPRLSGGESHGDFPRVSKWSSEISDG